MITVMTEVQPFYQEYDRAIQKVHRASGNIKAAPLEESGGPIMRREIFTTQLLWVGKATSPERAAIVDMEQHK